MLGKNVSYRQGDADPAGRASRRPSASAYPSGSSAFGSYPVPTYDLESSHRSTNIIEKRKDTSEPITRVDQNSRFRPIRCGQRWGVYRIRIPVGIISGCQRRFYDRSIALAHGYRWHTPRPGRGRPNLGIAASLTPSRYPSFSASPSSRT